MSLLLFLLLIIGIFASNLESDYPLISPYDTSVEDAIIRTYIPRHDKYSIFIEPPNMSPAPDSFIELSRSTEKWPHSYYPVDSIYARGMASVSPMFASRAYKAFHFNPPANYLDNPRPYTVNEMFYKTGPTWQKIYQNLANKPGHPASRAEMADIMSYYTAPPALK